MRKQGLTVNEYEILMAKVNELTHTIDVAKIELKDHPAAMEKIQLMEKTLMQLEGRMDALVSRN